jgi:transposase-like protein
MLTIDSNLRKYFKNHIYPLPIIMISIFMKGRYSLSDREIEEIGHLRLRAKRDGTAAKAFFRKAIRSSVQPIKVNIDKSGANTASLNSINEPLIKEEKIEIRQNHSIYLSCVYPRECFSFFALFAPSCWRL